MVTTFLTFPIGGLLCCLLGHVQGYHEEHHHHNHRHLGGDGKRPTKRCGTKSPTLAQQQEVARVVAEYLQARKEARARSAQATITVPVCLHGVNDKYSDTVLQKQLDALNKGHTNSSCCDTSHRWCRSGTCSVNTGFKFEMAVLDSNDKVVGTTTKVSDKNACKKTHVFPFITNIVPDTIVDQYVTKRIRLGGRNVLNLAFGPILDSYISRQYDLYGYSSMPWDYKSSPDEDAVYINPIAMAGGSDSYSSEGDSIVHEVGHWLGLYHTFENGCSSPGDYVDDTNYEASEAEGCPVGRNTCNNGTDPIHNFMDYTSDACVYAFTQGQADRMQALWSQYRA